MFLKKNGKDYVDKVLETGICVIQINIEQQINYGEIIIQIVLKIGEITINHTIKYGVLTIREMQSN